jgi:hypothetical protein
MLDIDNLLQKQLEALENGQSLDGVLAELPSEAGELAELIRLAAAIRLLPHPEPAQAFAPEQIRLAASEVKTQPARRRTPVPAPGIRLKFPRIQLPQIRLGPAMAYAGVGLVLVFAMLALFALGQGNARAATVMDVNGVVRVDSVKASGDWQPTSDGENVREGQRLVTGPGSSLTLVFYEGSRLTLGPNSFVTLTELSGGWGKSLRVVLTQQVGKTTHSVVPLKGTQSVYQVITPAGIASVHGTSFSVAVDESGASRFAVDMGKVVVSGQAAELALEAGQAAVSKPDELPESPDYQFSLEGELTSTDEGVWIVNGVSFSITSDTLLQGDPQVGSLVLVEGRITQDGERLADSVTTLGEADPVSTLTGIFSDIIGETWLVDGTPIWVDESTELGDGLELGMPVKVKFIVAPDGRWIALEIEPLVEEEAESEVTESPETTEPVTPTETITPTLFTNCTGANLQPKGSKLASEYGVPYEEIMGWFCQHFGFGEIDLAYGLSRQYAMSVEQIFALRRSGYGWGQIKKMLASGEVTPTPVITPTTTLTVTLTPTSTLVPTDTLVTPTPLPAKNDRNCPTRDDQPKAQSLAAKYGVPYEEIIGWFCRGFGFGEIDRAYSLSREYGVNVAEIFGMRASGLGWGQIKARLKASVVPASTPQPNPGNGSNHIPPGQLKKTPKP